MTKFRIREAIIPVVIACFALTVGVGKADNDYMVEKGDTLFKIGKLLGVPYQEIMKANGLKNTTIYPDQILRIPSGGRQYESEVPETVSRSVPVAASEPVTESKPVVATPVVASEPQEESKPEAVAPAAASLVATPVEGTHFYKKKESAQRPSYSATAYIPPVQGASKARSANSAPAPNPSTYTVQPGDSVLSISRKFGVTPWSLRKANNIQFSPIYEGLVLQVPKRSLVDMAAL